tara:strand:+ start:3642 stop:4217 length:576 start_codon:yes stop_codon:yes gene_type:complete
MLKAYLTNKIEAGCDEAGRGCLAGPVVASAVILPKNFTNNILNDSKKLSKKKILLLSNIIKENALSFSIGIATVKEIDKINILNASILAMHRAINTLTIKAELLLIDGNHFKKHSIPHQCIIKGDSKLMSIAAASILAKNYRDELMKKLNIEHPEYNWLNNKGYPTNEHRKNIQNFGITKHHRKSFQLLKN